MAGGCPAAARWPQPRLRADRDAPGGATAPPPRAGTRHAVRGRAGDLAQGLGGKRLVVGAAASADRPRSDPHRPVVRPRAPRGGPSDAALDPAARAALPLRAI